MDSTCSELGIKTLDLFPMLSNGDPDSYYFEENELWNDRGQEVAAKEVARWLSSEFKESPE